MKKIIAFITIITLTTSVFAQKEQSKHEISLWGAYGLSTLNYDLTQGTHNLGLGFLGGLGYNYYLNYHWSIGIGAELQQFTSALEVNNFSDYYYLAGLIYSKDLPAGLPLGHVSGKVAQDYSIYYINVPVQVKYQLDAFKTHKWYLAANLKFGIPFQGTYNTDATYSARWRDDSKGQDWLALQSNVASNAKDAKFETRLNTSLGLETGIKWDLGKKWALYTGVFANYGLVDIRKGDIDLAAGMFEKADVLKADLSFAGQNSVLNSRYTAKEADALTREYATGKTAFAKYVNTIDAGIKVQLAIGVCGVHVKKAKTNELLDAVKAIKPVTADEVNDIVGDNAKKIIDANKDNLDELKKYIDDKFKKEASEVKEGLRLETVWGFDLDKTVLKSGTMNEIANRNLETLRQHPEIRVNLVGNTDDYASVAYNNDLGMRRAQAVKDWLISKGIAASRLEVSTQGKEKPFVPNSDEANRRYNRRVEFLIIK